MRDFALCYIFFCVFCFIMIFELLVSLTPAVGSRGEVRAFRLMSVSVCICLIAEILWIAGETGFISFSRPANYIVNAYDNTFTGLTVYFWYTAVIIMCDHHLPKNRVHRFLIDIPILLLIFLNITSWWTHLTFYIDASNHYVRGSLYILQITCSCIYFVFTLIAEIKGVIGGTMTERALYRKFIICTVIPVAVGIILQVTLGHFPFTMATMTATILFFFISILKQRIGTDALTGINNREQCDEQLEDLIENADDDPFYLYMIDINDFKHINDTYGHNSGDEALILVSKALRHVIRSYAGFVGRFGGDKFIAVIAGKDMETPDLFLSQLNDRIDRYMKEAGHPFTITVAAGYTLCDESTADRKKVIQKADMMLYRIKAKMKAS